MDLNILGQLYKAENLSNLQKLDLVNKINTTYCIPNNTCKNLQEMSGYNCLHIAAMKQDHDLVYELLKLGAEPFCQGTQDRKTPLHVALDVITDSKGKKIWEINGKLQECQVVNTLLSAHITGNNFYNPKCKHGVSHLHIACMFNCVDAVKFFLNNEEPIDQFISDDSHWPLYTPLYLAMRYSSVEVAEILLCYGADLHAKNADGASPLHILINRILDLADYDSMGDQIICEPYEEELKKLEAISIIIIKLENENGQNILDDTGLKTFHLACVLRDSSIAARMLCLNDINLNVAVRSNSKFWPGWTTLHFAACSSAETVKLLMRKRAFITIKNKQGETPLDFCMKRYNPEIVHSILFSRKAFKKILMSNSSTTLLDTILAMNDMTAFQNYLESLTEINIFVNPTSSLFPGYNLLHLAISMNSQTKFRDIFFAEAHLQVYNCTEEESQVYSERILACLEKGCSVDFKNDYGLTPIHLAFKHLVRPDLLQKLLNHCQADVADPENLTHLHIACAVGNKKVVCKLLKTVSNVNGAVEKSFQWYKINNYSSLFLINANSTCLHIAVLFEHADIVIILLESGADFYAIDCEGYTPIHLSIANSKGSNEIAKMLIEKLNQEELIDLTTKEDLTHLHVAAFAGDVTAITTLICKNSNINSRINKTVPAFLSRFAGKTPLQIATHISPSNVMKTVKVLIELGTNIYDNNTLQLLMDNTDFDSSHYLIDELKLNYNNDGPIDSSGLTLLHVACSVFYLNWTKNLMTNGAEINARIRNDEDYKGFWKGYTPLHALVSRKNLEVSQTLRGVISTLGKLLLERGADVMVETDDGTPLHLEFSDYLKRVDIQDLPLNIPLQLPERLRRSDDNGVQWLEDHLASLMLQKQTIYYINPISPDGYSHFHFFCMANRVDAVREYLDNGVDVDHSTNPLSGSFAGSTGLHFAFAFKAFAVANLLIERGANVNFENAEGNTPIHFITLNDKTECQYPAITSLIRRGADFNIRNLQDQTPIDVMMTRKYFILEQWQTFVSNGLSINFKKSSLSPGPIQLIIDNALPGDRMQIFEMFIYDPNIRDAVKSGYDAIKDLVKANVEVTADDYFNIILGFIDKGWKMDQPDEEGFTALHYAIILENAEALSALLQLGADANACNIDSQLFESRSKIEIHEQLAVHVHKMHILGLFVSESNDLIYRQFTNKTLGEDIEIYVKEELKKSERIKFNETLTARAFLSESSGIASYSKISSVDRKNIDVFFKNFDYLHEQFPLLCGLMLSQYKKALISAKLHDGHRERGANLRM